MSLLVKNSTLGESGGWRNWFTAPRRMARRKGFGIHSPFAFDFVRRVIAQPCAYYDYERIEKIASESGANENHLRLLYRVGLFFRPRIIIMAGCVSEAEKVVLSMGCPSAEMRSAFSNDAVGADTLFLVGKDACLDNGSMVDAARSGTHVVILDARNGDGRLDALWRGTDNGMLFCGRRTAVYAAMSHLPHQCFDIWF